MKWPVKLALWTLQLFALAWLLPGSSADVQLAFLGIPLAVWMLGSAAIGAGGSIIGGAQAAQAGKPSFSAGDRSSIRRPAEVGAFDDAVLSQTLLALGVDPQTIQRQLFINSLGRTHRGGVDARFMEGQFAAIDSLLLQGGEDNLAKAQRIVERINRKFGLTTAGGIPVRGSAPGMLRIEGGQLVTELAGERGRQLNELVAGSSDIFSNRIQAIQNISRITAGVPEVTRAGIDQLSGQIRDIQTREINEQADLQSRNILQEANRLGLNPAAVLAELEEERLQQLQASRPGSLAEAINILNAQTSGAANAISAIQSGLNPFAVNQLTSTASPGQVAAVQGSQALGQGIAGAGANLQSGIQDLVGLRLLQGNQGQSGPAALPSLDQFLSGAGGVNFDFSNIASAPAGQPAPLSFLGP